MDALLGNARALTQELIREGCPEAKVHLIYNGVRPPVAPTSRTEAREELGLDTQAFVTTTVANLLSYKGHLDIIAALAEIADRLPRPWVMLCAGRDGGSRAKIEQAIAQAGLGGRVRLLGERNDVARILAASDLGVLAPTRNEGFSNAVLESMAAGLPMVVTDVGGNAEAVLDGKTGLVVPPHEPSALGAAILRLAEEPPLRWSMSERTRRRAADQFSLEASVDGYCALYEELLRRQTVTG
jgi:glycosyltransferase involved in cell wall biosynthesis